MRDDLKQILDDAKYQECWDQPTPPYELFLDIVSQRLEAKSESSAKIQSVSMKRDGRNRVRVDGTISCNGANEAFYVEVVWLPTLGNFRASANVRAVIKPPAPKSVSEFIDDLDSIVDEQKVIFVGQVFNALEGVDCHTPDIRAAFPAIFRLFERLPDEDFGNPGHLVHLLLQLGGFEEHLRDSLQRTPSILACYLAYCLATSDDLAEHDRLQWLFEIQRIAAAESISTAASRFARELLRSEAPNQRT